jgi:hypothetical protein
MMKFKDNNDTLLEGELVKTFSLSNGTVFFVFNTGRHPYYYGAARHVVPAWRVPDNLKNKQLEDYL